ncbi:MAG: hypothetical protein NT047_01785 [Deltaproteobacteria bacterium]|nr:hypothetical protein [Deltaproteobacteria bacterium]
MKFKEIALRLTGISCPIFGASWNPPESEVVIARRVITALEDRRVLYVPSEVEIPDHCVQSVIEIRHFLTAELGGAHLSDALRAHLREMRAACRKFLTCVQEKDREVIPFANRHGHWASWVFMDALGQMRGEFGIHIAQMAVRYGLDVENDLSTILPEKDEEADAEHGVVRYGTKPRRL